MLIPKNEKEANQIVIRLTSSIINKSPQSDEWAKSVYDAFMAIFAFDQDNRFEEHSDALMDVLLLRGRHVIMVMLAIIADFPDPESFAPAARKAEEFILRFKDGTALSEHEILDDIAETFET